MANKTKNDYKNITRYDYGGVHGWYVRVMWKGKKEQKIIRDNQYKDDKDKSLKAAVRCRNEMEKELGKPRSERYLGALNFKQGVTKIKRERDGYEAYIVTYSPEKGKVHRKFFSVKKYGDRNAKKMAQELRDKMVKKYYFTKKK